MRVWLADAAACGPDRRRVADYADICRGVVGPRGRGDGLWWSVILASRWDDVCDGQQFGSVCIPDDPECWISHLYDDDVYRLLHVGTDSGSLARMPESWPSPQICLASLAG